MSTTKRYISNASTGLIAQAIATAVGIALVPYTLTRLGKDGFGVYQLARSAVVLLQFLNFGMGPTLVRYLANASAKDDDASIASIGSTGYLIMGSLAALALLLFIPIVPIFINFYEIPIDLRAHTSGMLLCLVASFSLNLLTMVPRSILQGANRYDLAHVLDIGRTLLQFSLIVFMFELASPNVLALGTAIVTAETVRFVAMLTAAYKTAGKSAFFSWSAWSRAQARSLLGFSSLTFMNSVAAFFIVRGPILIIGKTLGLDAVTQFAPAALVATSLQGLIVRINGPLVPIASKARAENSLAALGKWAITITQLNMLVGLVAVIAFSTFGPELTALWLGADMAHIWLIIAIMATETTISQSAAAIYSLALGGGDIRPVVWSQIQAGVLISGGIALGTSMGGWGLMHVALFILLCRGIRNTLYLPWTYSRPFGYSLHRYLLRGCLSPLALAAVLVASFRMIATTVPLGNLWRTFLLLPALLGSFLVIAWLLLIPRKIKSAIANSLPFLGRYIPRDPMKSRSMENPS